MWCTKVIINIIIIVIIVIIFTTTTIIIIIFTTLTNTSITTICTQEANRNYEEYLAAIGTGPCSQDMVMRADVKLTIEQVTF